MSDRLPAYEHALGLLTGCAYASRTLRRKLVQKGFDASDIDSAIDRLSSSGILDDAKYAEHFARGKLLGTGASKRRIRQQLFQRGIPLAVADSAVDTVVEDEAVDLAALAERDARKKLASLTGLDPMVIRRRLYSHLARRGHDLDAINVVMKKVMKAE